METSQTVQWREVVEVLKHLEECPCAKEQRIQAHKQRSLSF